MCQLLRRGLIAALAPVGVPNCDIVITNDIGERLCALQVKTRREMGSDGGWHMSEKHEKIVSPSLFYCFVDFGRSLVDPPACYLVPSAVVADVLSRAHQYWLAAPGKGGKPHNETSFRRFLPNYDKVGIPVGCGPGWLDGYRENWDALVGAADL